MGAEPPMAGEGPVGRKAGHSVEPPGGYTTPVRPDRKVLKSVLIARVKAWKLERQKAHFLGGSVTKHRRDQRDLLRHQF